MLTPAPPQFHKRRARIKAASPAPAAAGHRILLVECDAMTVAVTTDGVVTDLIDVYEAFKVRIDGEWVHAVEADWTSPPMVFFEFDVDASAATEWRVFDPES